MHYTSIIMLFKYSYLYLSIYTNDSKLFYINTFLRKYYIMLIYFSISISLSIYTTTY